MARRTIDVGGCSWEVSSTGRVTQYARDEFGVTFRQVGGTTPEVRVARFAPGLELKAAVAKVGRPALPVS